jgi:hypothetical protein
MKNLFKALANFQQECPTIHKGTKGYGYSYSDLPTIFNVINPLLKNNGLGFTQLVNDNTIKTILFHCETGETLESETVIPNEVKLKGMNDFQVLGSAISYLRRYAISSMLGLVTDKDIDAGGEQVKKNPTLTKDGLNYLLTKGTPQEIQTAIKTRTLTDAQRLQLIQKSNG